MRTPKDNPTHTYTKTSNRIRKRIPSSKFQSSSIIQKLPYSSCTEQTANNHNQKEGEMSSNAGNERRKSYANIVNQNICHPYKTINNTNSDIEKQIYHPHRKKQITYQSRNHNKSSTTNNSSSIYNNIPSPNQHNIQLTHRTDKNTTKIR